MLFVTFSKSSRESVCQAGMQIRKKSTVDLVQKLFVLLHMLESP